MPDSVGGLSVATKLQQSLRTLVIITVILFMMCIGIATAGILYAIDQNNKTDQIVQENRSVAITTNRAICTLRADFERRVDESKKFLQQHPEGIPGISPQTIQTGIDNTQSTIDALSVVQCPPESAYQGSP